MDFGDGWKVGVQSPSRSHLLEGQQNECHLQVPNDKVKQLGREGGGSPAVYPFMSPTERPVTVTTQTTQELLDLISVLITQHPGLPQGFSKTTSDAAKLAELFR